MAQVSVSLPDKLLAQVDAMASERGLTRSTALRLLVEEGFAQRGHVLSIRMAELEGLAQDHGGDVAAVLKAERPST
ncbi:MAG: ribbon-helix-helix protein, CopG family [Chloroflexi bacterium]|nr:ribbon-helix-helix protein, CopG family [Chloroflexota bacterium]